MEGGKTYELQLYVRSLGGEANDLNFMKKDWNWMSQNRVLTLTATDARTGAPFNEVKQGGHCDLVDTGPDRIGAG